MVYDLKKDYNGTSAKSYFDDKAVIDYTMFPYNVNTNILVFKCKNGSVMSHEINQNAVGFLPTLSELV